MNKKNVSKIIASSMIVANIPTSLAVELIDEKIINNSLKEDSDISDIKDTENLHGNTEDNLIDENKFNHNQNEINNITEENLSNDINQNEVDSVTQENSSSEINIEEFAHDINNELNKRESKYSGGYGTEESPYLLGTVKDLIDLSNDINNGNTPDLLNEHGEVLYYKLINDINFDDYKPASKNYWFNPIGTYENPFIGVFDGNGHTISNLHTQSPGRDGVLYGQGLFGVIKDSNIKNLNLDSFYINGEEYVGGLAGIAINDNIIENVKVSNIELSGEALLGGLIGFATEYVEYLDPPPPDDIPMRLKERVSSNIDITTNYTLTILNSSIEGEIYSPYGLSGGFVGASNFVDIIISDSNSKADISANDSYCIGGFVGAGISNISIKSSKFEGNIKDCTLGAGGFIGIAYSSEIYNSESKGSINAGYVTGGFIGGTSKLKIDNVKSNNTINSEAISGGIVGVLVTLGDSDTSSINYIKNSNINASVNCIGGAGGLVGVSISSINIENVNFKGNIIGTIANGGFIGITIGSLISEPDLTYSESFLEKSVELLAVSGSSTLNSDISIRIDNSDFQGNIYGDGIVGGFVGASMIDELLIDNCNTKGNIYSDFYAGGFVGYSTFIDIINSDNEINIYEMNIEVGEKTSKADTDRLKSLLSSLEIDTDSCIGGLIGTADFVNINNSKSNSIISSTGYNIGGLVGECNGSLNILNSEVIGKIKSSSYNIGGLVGCFEFNKDKDTFNNISAYQDSLVYIKDCSNNLDIQGYEYIGGMIGSVSLYEETPPLSKNIITTESFNSTKIIDSKVKGSIVGGFDTGGLIGYSDNKADIIGTNVEANVIGLNEHISGMIAYSDDEVCIKDSKFKGRVDGEGYIGSFVGESPLITILNSDALANIHSNGNMTGGLVGVSENIIAENSGFNGIIYAGDHIGGLVGSCDNISTNNVIIKGSINGNHNVGGLIGTSCIFDDSSYIKSTYVESDITGSANVGGIIGSINPIIDNLSKGVGIQKPNDVYINIYKSFYDGNIKGIGYVGGLIGYSRLSNINIVNAYTTGNLDASLTIGRFIGYLDSYYPPKIYIKNGYSATKLVANELNSDFNFIGFENFEEESYKYNTKELDYYTISDCYVVMENLYYDKDLNSGKFNPIEEEIFNNVDNEEKHFIIGLSTKNMQNNRPLQTMKLDYDNIWFTNKDYYPTFVQKEVVEDDKLSNISVELEKDSEFDALELILDKDEYITNEEVEVIEHNVDVSIPGVYFIKYRIIDNYGYKIEREMKVTVINKDNNNSTEENKPESGDNNNNNNSDNNNNNNSDNNNNNNSDNNNNNNSDNNNNNNNNSNSNSNSNNSNSNNNNSNSNNNTNNSNSNNNSDNSNNGTNNSDINNNSTAKPSTGDNSLIFMITTIISSLGLVLINKDKDKNKK